MSTVEQPRLVTALCLLAGLSCLFFSLAFNEYALSLFDSHLAASPAKLAEIRSSQLAAALVGILLLGMFALIKSERLPPFAMRALDRPTTLKLGIALGMMFLPLFLLELASRPFTLERHSKKMTTIFVRDADLGWRLRPTTKDRWGKVLVEINGKGLRGPEIEYEREGRAKRLLYLGDSVAFGYGLRDFRQSFPYVVESVLEEEKGVEVETVNAAVSGYSPWQHFEYLRTEGIKYNPDLVILTFVLNDVTEKLTLFRFGGFRTSPQLAASYHSLTDRLSHMSALVMYLTQMRARWRFGANLEKGATRHEVVVGRDLILSPDAPGVKSAWDLTLKSMDKIVSFCEDQHLPLVLVAFPYSSQLHDPQRSSAPQKRLAAFARKARIPYLDLLPALSRHLTEYSLGPRALFLDHSHLTPMGSRVAGHQIAKFLRRQPGWSRMQKF